MHRLPGSGSCDVVQDRTHDGRVFRTLNVIDEFTREALMIRVDRKLSSVDVLDALTDLFILRGQPEYIRSDNALSAKAGLRLPASGPRVHR